MLAFEWLWIHYFRICRNIVLYTDGEILQLSRRHWRCLRHWANVLLLLLLLLCVLFFVVFGSSYKFEETLIGARIKITLKKAAMFSQLCLWSFKSFGTWSRVFGRVLFDVSNDRNGAILLGLHYLKDEGTLILPNIQNHSPRDTVSHPEERLWWWWWLLLFVFKFILAC